MTLYLAMLIAFTTERFLWGFSCCIDAIKEAVSLEGISLQELRGTIFKMQSVKDGSITSQKIIEDGGELESTLVRKSPIGRSRRSERIPDLKKFSRKSTDFTRLRSAAFVAARVGNDYVQLQKKAAGRTP